MRKSGDRVRITAQLIDALTGRHLWAERYDRELKDLFALQDDITLNILKALEVKLSPGTGQGLTEKGTKSLDAYIKLLEALDFGHRGTKEGNIMRRKLSEEAIAMDPEYPRAYLMLSATHLLDILYGASESPEKSLKMAEELVKKALSLNDKSAWGHAFLGRIYLTQRQYEKAIAEGERALSLDPNSDFVQAALAYTLRNAGKEERAVALMKRAIRLNPIPPPWYLGVLGSSYYALKRYKEAEETGEKMLGCAPDSLMAHLLLAAVYSEMGRQEDAKIQASEIQRINPKFTLEHFPQAVLIRNQDEKRRYIDALRKAGLPE